MRLKVLIPFRDKSNFLLKHHEGEIIDVTEERATLLISRHIAESMEEEQPTGVAPSPEPVDNTEVAEKAASDNTEVAEKAAEENGAETKVTEENHVAPSEELVLEQDVEKKPRRSRQAKVKA